MKKNLLFGIFALFIMTLCTTKVYARNYTDYLPNPYMYRVIPDTYTGVYKLKASYGTCRAQDVGVMYYHFKTLPDLAYFKNEYEVVINVTLFEDDPEEYEPDELLTRYQVVYYDLTMDHIYVDKVKKTGNIDSSGDDTCEFYTSWVMSGSTRGAFNYQVLEYRIFVE